MSENSPSESLPQSEEEKIKEPKEKISEISREVEYFSQIVVDYTLPLDSAIESGGYEDINPHIAKVNFPESREDNKKEIIFKLFAFDSEVESGEAIKEMDKEGYRPATCRELMAFAQVNPEVQRYFPINALGTVVNHPKNNVPCVFEIWSYTGKRRVSFNDSVRKWDRYCRFFRSS